MLSRAARSPMTLVVAALVAFVVVGAVVLLVGTSMADDNYIDIADVPESPLTHQRGEYTVDCGNNEGRHLNADNPVISPGIRFGAHHTHEYVGNESSDFTSTDESMSRAKSTCGQDLSAYFWPALRLTDGTGHDAHAEGGGAHGNTGEVLPPSNVRISFHGNAKTKVLPMPRFLRTITGDPMASTNESGDRVRASWSCSDQPRRSTTKYPLCDSGDVVRTFEFASCWDGVNTDSASHRTHVVFPSASGMCPARTFPVPVLRLTVTYDVPQGRPFAIDSFPDQNRDPATDHAMFVNVMPVAMMNELVGCINEGRYCSSSH